MIIGRLGGKRREGAAASAPRIMIVDDDDDIRTTLIELLQHMDFEVVAAAHGLEAMSQLRTGAPPDVIFLDLMMPEMDGYQFLVELRKQSTLSSIPVVIITAAGNAHDEAVKLGANGYLQKPFKVDELLAAIDRIRQLSPAG